MPNSLSLLPLSPDELSAGTKIALIELGREGLTRDEGLLKLNQDLDSWLDGSAPRSRFPAALEPVLSAAGWTPPKGQRRGQCYGTLVEVIAGRFTRSRRGAAMVLSNLPFILLMARDWRASPARIARLVRQSDTEISVGWRLIEVILNRFKLNTAMDRRKVASLLESDRIESEQEMGDATIATVVEHLEARADDLGLGGDFKNGLGFLLQPPTGTSFIPYLQALLYICTIDHFSDHPPEFIYTYKPRGDVANLIFSAFPPGLAPGGNPILNNFKAVDRLGPDWAESREDTREQARALVMVVQGLSSLAYSPRRHMSAAIRKALARFIQIRIPAPIHLGRQDEVAVVERFLNRVAAEPTNTKGVIEQRVVDFLGAFEFAGAEWRARGLGDPVHATNSSSGKLGDCDFQNISLRRCVALEAHAGKLTDIYVREHLRTLTLNLPRRLREWDQINGLAEWDLAVRFLVHEDAHSDTAFAVTDDITARLEVLTYREHYLALLPQLRENPRRTVELFNQWVVMPLEADNTPPAAKQRAKELLAAE